MTNHEAPVSTVSRTALSTVDELAEEWGVSRWMIYRLVRAGDLRAVRVGERLRFRPEDVKRYLERGPT